LTQGRLKVKQARSSMSGKDETPIACTLGGNDFHERLAWIAQLNRDGLQSHRRDAMTLELRYAAAVRDRVHQLVRQEAECCAFLGFAVSESADHVSVTITVPERASEMAGDLLAPFLPSGSAEREQQAGCCSSGGGGCGA
jgi:hypothetical protein